MNLFFRLAWRNIWRHRRRTLIIVTAIGLCVAMMMMYDGLVAGFEQAIYGNAIRVLGGNIQIHAAGYRNSMQQTPLIALENDLAAQKAAESLPLVQSATRRIVTSGLASSRKGAFPVEITGVEPEKEKPFSLVAQHTSAGRYLTGADKEMIFIGKGLADVMDVVVGDRITLVGRTSHNQLRRHSMTIAGIFDVGLRDIEKRSVYLSLVEAQYLYELKDQSTEVAITLEQIGQEAGLMNTLKNILPGTEIDSWETSFPDMQYAINTKGGVMNVFSVIILIIAGIGILNMLLMAVYERTREIGLLGAIGLKSRQISFLFLLEGALTGLVGVIFGLALGLLFNIILGQIGLDYSQFAGMTEYTALISGRVYPTLGLEKFAERVLTVLVIAILAAFYPAREAARKEPAEALHYV